MIKLGPPVKRSLFTLSALFFTANAMVADSAYHTNTVNKILTGYSDKAVYFALDDTTINPANCSTASVYGIDPATRDVQAMLAILLTAKTTETPVEIKVAGGECFGSYPSVKLVILR